MTVKPSHAISVNKAIFAAPVALCLALTLYTLPATWSLAPGRRRGLAPLTIEEAAEQLKASGLAGWKLVEAARLTVATRMCYSRRNGFAPAGCAFDRGYGYCQQMAFALHGLLRELGLASRVVQAFRNRFPDGGVDGHAWVSVQIGDETRWVDALFYDAERSQVTFQPLSRVTGMGLLFRIFAGWGAAALNAHRYYCSGADR